MPSTWFRCGAARKTWNWHFYKPRTPDFIVGDVHGCANPVNLLNNAVKLREGRGGGVWMQAESTRGDTRYVLIFCRDTGLASPVIG